MRRLMWFAIGFGAACALGACLLPQTGLIPPSLLCLGLGGLIFFRRHKNLRRIGWACLGCAAGLAWFWLFQQDYLAPAAALDGMTVETTITASDYGWDASYGTAFDGTVELQGKTYQVRAYLNKAWDVEPGDLIQGSFRFRVTTDQGAQEATYHQGKGIFLLGYQSGEAVLVPADQIGLRHYPAILARKIKDILWSFFPADTAPFAQALLLGDSTALDYETETVFKVSGIRHIIAVSGLHVSILYGLISLITGKRRFLTAIAGTPVLVLFAALAGFTPSVTRACIMVCLMLMATAVNREYDPPTALGFAALVMLAANPLVITSVSFQLSVASMAGIYLFYEPLRGWLREKLREGSGNTLVNRVKRWFASSVAVTLSAMSLTTPLTAYYFGAVSLIGPVTNLLTLWAVSIVFYGIIAVVLLSWLWPWMAGVLAKDAALLIRYILSAAGGMAEFPLAAVYTKSVYIVAWLVFVYILLVVFLLSPKRRPGVLACCGCLALCLALLASWAEPLMDECRVTVLDVGQGQSILLQSGGRTFLVDCGGDYDDGAADTAAETLLAQGITRLDGIIVTHYDRDHAGGVENLLSRVDADLLLMPAVESDGVAETLTAACGGEAVPVEGDLVLTWGGTEMRIFGPTFASESNENSLCVLFETENCAILITGDRSEFGERMLLRTGDLPDVDLLIAGHHGSKYSTSAALLEAVMPETVIISVGKNSYGHPAEELLARLAQYGCAVYRTDELGTILFRR